MSGFNVVDLERTGRGDQFGGNLGAEGQWLRRGEARADDHVAVFQQRDRDDAGLFLKGQMVAADRAAVACTGACQRERGADIGVAGKRHFVAWREDAHPGGMTRIFRRQYEGRLRQIEFGGNRLHLRG